MNFSLRSGILALLIAAFVLPCGVVAQTYPAKPVRYIVPYAPGGGVDIVSRLLATKLSENLAQQVVVDNRPGGGTILGSELLTKSPADGYTIMMGNIALDANPSLRAKLPYNTEKDFAPVGLVALLPAALVVHPSLPVKSVSELVKLAQSKSGQLNYASAGTGSFIHLVMELFKSVTKTNIVHVPYKGAGPALNDVLAGHVTIMFITIPPALQHIQAGKLRVLAVSSSHRLPTLPNAPTAREAGYPGFELYDWQGVLAPANTPANVITKLNTEINKIVAVPDFKERVAGLGAEAAGSSPEQLGERIKTDIVRWSKIIKTTAIDAD